MKIKLPKLKIPKVYIYGIDVIKNFIFFTLYIILTLLAIAFIITPAVKLFKKTQKEYYITKAEFEKHQNTYNQTLNELNKLKKENKHILLALKRDFNPVSFKNFASTYMNIKEINKTEASYFKDNFIKTTYIITATIKTPKNFYDFIDALEKYKYLIRVYFPIKFEKVNKEILLKLKIEHFKLKNDKLNMLN
jgi:uncharacterized membrane protein YhiD involved in acid resistance